jgi:hypothetical protein
MSREQGRWSVASFEARVYCPTARPMDDACAGSRANQATAARRSRSRCLVDAVVSAPVLVVSSVNLDDSSNATQIVFGRLPLPRLAAVRRRPRRRWG